MQDIRFAVRQLLKNRGFAVVAVLSLALGIGANTAIFSLINAVMLRMLPVRHPEELVLLTNPTASGMSIGIDTGRRGLLTYPEFVRIRDRNQIFSGVLAAQSHAERLDVIIGGNAESGAKEAVRSKLVSGNYFKVLELNPVIGRLFSPAEDGAFGSSPYAVISHEYWRHRFQMDPAVLGKPIKVYKTMFTIIGVTPPGFSGETVGDAVTVWFPLTMQHEVDPGREFLVQKPGAVEKVMWLQVIGRMKPGGISGKGTTGLKQAQAGLNVLFQQILAEDEIVSVDAQSRSDLKDQRIELQAGGKGASSLREQFSEPLFVLMAVVGLVLLIACGNLANLLLARGIARQKEVGIRLALGARRARLIRQLMTESVLLAMAGGALGVLFAWWADKLLLVMVSGDPSTIPLDVAPDARLLLFTGVVSVATGILFGLAPALRATRLDLNTILKENARGSTESHGKGMGFMGLSVGKVLVGLQVALSLMLLIGAGLFVRNLMNLTSTKLGYDPDRLTLIPIDPTPSGYKGAAITHLYEQLLDRIRALPGVRGASLSQNGLFSGSESGDMLSVEGFTSKNKKDLSARFDQVAPGYFATLGIPVILGREFGPQDSGKASRVCAINETMAKFYFPNANPIGKHITDEFPDSRLQFQIVGVVRDAKYNNVREKTPRRFYIPFFNGMGDPSFAKIEVRTFANPAAVVSAIRHEVQQLDSTLTLGDARSMGELVDRSLTQDHLIARLSAFFGALALLLAAIGLYGVMSFAMTRRTSEIGIRMALGADRSSVIRMVLRESMVLVAIGIAIGLPGALGASRIVASRLYGLQTTDPTTLTGATAVLIAVALVAGLIPAIRASRVDPMNALRFE